MAKAACWALTDAEARKPGERKMCIRDRTCYAAAVVTTDEALTLFER